MEHQPKLSFVTEEILTKDKWEAIMINNLIFIKTTNWTLMIHNAAPQIEIAIGCPNCFSKQLNPFIIVGSGIMKGMMNCTNCATNIIVGFHKESYDFIKTAYKIEQNLIDENWKPEKQNLQ